MYESELIPLFEKCGKIWDLRLMMDPMTGLNRGYAFVTFTTREAAHEAVCQVHICLKTLQLFVYFYKSGPPEYIPKNVNIKKKTCQMHSFDFTGLKFGKSTI